MKLAIYYRVSTDKQDHDSQRHHVESFIKKEHPDAVVVATFEDVASGAKETRPGFLALQALVKSKAVDAVVVYKMDRLTRAASTALRLILQWDEAGVAFIATSQPILNLGPGAPMRRVILAIFAELAQLERDMISQRTKDGIAASRARGNPVHQRTPPRLEGQFDRLIALDEMLASGTSLQYIPAALGVSKRTLERYLTKLGRPSDRKESAIWLLEQRAMACKRLRGSGTD